MDAKDKRLDVFLQGLDKRFKVPIYQRNYDWGKEHCKKLIDDIQNTIDKNIDYYFIGSFVTIFNDTVNGLKEYLIIDGQQRLTTISLILTAIRELTEDTQLKQIIEETYLINKWKEKNTDERIRLKSIKKDHEAFRLLVDEEEIADEFKDSQIVINYNIIIDELKKIDLKKFYEKLVQLIIVDVSLDKDKDDPQLIFESMNSTGKNLEQSDLVRNFILMKEKEQDRLYKEYWRKIEENTNFQVSDFIKNYLIIKTNIYQVERKIYENFKNFVIDKKNKDANYKIEALLEELLKYSGYYREIIREGFDDDRVNYALGNLNKLKYSVSYPFLIRVVEKYKNEAISKEDFINIIAYLESYLLRRFICEKPTNALNKIFSSLARDVERNNNYDEKNYFEVLKYILNNKTVSGIFPKDEEFREKLKTKDIYNQKKHNSYFFSRIENFSKNNILNFEETSIEHIMPKKLKKEWKEMLGNNYQGVHEKYINRLGNLTLLNIKDNQEIQNKPFQEKLNFIKAQSSYSLNEYFKNNAFKKWAEEEINQRAEEISNLCLKIWKYEKSIITDTEKNLTFDLNTDEDFTNKKVKSYTFLENETKVATWKDLFSGVCEELYKAEGKAIFKDKIKQVFNIPEEYITINKKDELDFTNFRHSTQNTIRNLKKLLTAYDLDYEDLNFTTTD